MTEEQFRRLMSSGSYLWDHMAEAPVIPVPCQSQPKLAAQEALPPEVRVRYLEEQRYVERIRGASIYPAVQNIILACRAFVPDDEQTFALMPIGYPRDKFGPVVRRPVAEIAHADRRAQPWPA
jgi:hypothetical protein